MSHIRTALAFVNKSMLSDRQLAYWELTKPRIAVMVLVTICVAGLVAADGRPDPWKLWHVAFGMFLVAASGNAMNMFLERYTDFLMRRTAKRPLPDRRLTATQVATFGSVCFGIGIGYMLTTLGWPTALCALATWILYVFVYTPLKTRTWFNTEVGALAGALPIVAGSLATSNTMNLQTWSLFLVLVFWQFPHFMAIAWLYRYEYRDSGLQMLTVVDPTGRRAGQKAIALVIVTWLVSLIPALGMKGVAAPVVFVGLASLAAAFYVWESVRFAQAREDRTARRLLRVSVIYLPIYLLLLVVFCRL